VTARFVACIACGQHVRVGDEACPFCGAAASPAPPPPRGLRERVSRAAMLAAGAAGGVIVLVDCGNGNTNTQVFYGVACTGDACSFPMDDGGDGSAGDGDAPTEAAPDGGSGG
jgi:hypothetical protein